jgi:O-succinylbenzoic acid--CoA ligase
VIEWLRRVDPDRPYLRLGDLTLSYGSVADEVEARIDHEPVLLRPALDVESVVGVLAGISRGGLTVVGPAVEGVAPARERLVVFTSGTTGPPRGVRLTAGNLAAAAEASAAHLGHGPEDDWLLAMPLHHVGGLSILVRQAFTGGAVTLLPRFDPGPFSAAMRGNVTMVSVVPTMLRRLLGAGPYSGLRAVLVGGGPIPDGLLEEAAGAGLPVLPTYGMTETFGQVATLRPGSPPERKAHPLPGVSLRIEPDGRVAVSGAQVSPGYLGEPDRVDPWLVTNDLGELDGDGSLRILGRADTVIVTGGEKVSPEQVEATLRQHPGVAEVLVVGLPDAEWGEMVACIFEGDLSAEALGSWAAERLPGYMVPRRWQKVERMPRTDLGKLDRTAARRGAGG